MYYQPNLKRCLTLLAIGSGILSTLFLTGCATTKGKSAKTDEALYLFDDGTGDLPAVENYAGNDAGAELNFTESEQVAPVKAKAQTKPTASQAPQYVQNTPPPPPSPSYNGGGGNIMDHGGSDVLSTPPTPVKSGTNYGNAYAESDSGAAEPVTKSRSTAAASSDDDEPAPVKKKSTKSSGTTRTYVVRRGDTLSEIAGRYGTTVSKLKSINDMSGTRIMIGQKLKVTGSGSGATATATSGKKKSSASSKSASRHTVRSGDNLWDISRKYGVSVTAIKNANGMSSSNLTPGQKLKIP